MLIHLLRKTYSLDHNQILPTCVLEYAVLISEKNIIGILIEKKLYSACKFLKSFLYKKLIVHAATGQIMRKLQGLPQLATKKNVFFLMVGTDRWQNFGSYQI